MFASRDVLARKICLGKLGREGADGEERHYSEGYKHVDNRLVGLAIVNLRGPLVEMRRTGKENHYTVIDELARELIRSR